MSLVTLLLPLCVAADSTAVLERFVARYIDSPSYEATFDGVVNGLSFRSHNIVHTPEQQNLTMSTKGGLWRFEQDHNGLIALDTGSLSYWDSTPFPHLTPGLDVGRLIDAWPNCFYQSKAELLAGGGLKYLGKEALGAISADHLSYSKVTQDASVRVDFYIDGVGKLLKYSSHTHSPMGSDDRDFTLVSDSVPAESLEVTSTEPPSGFVEAELRQHIQVPQGGDPFTWPKGVDARTGDKVDLKKLLSGHVGVVFFSQPDCSLCQEIEPSLQKLSQAVRAKGGQVVEFSVGSEKPDLSTKDPSRLVAMNAEEVMAGGTDIPMTPYAVVVDADGLMIRAWAGFAPDQADKFVKTMTEALDLLPLGKQDPNAPVPHLKKPVTGGGQG